MGIEYAVSDGIATITLSNPERANILDHATAAELSEAWRQVWEVASGIIGSENRKKP